MKSLKMFGLAALAALLAMAFIGASSAMAENTGLCKADESPCSPENIVTHVHETSVGKAALLASPKIECDVLFLGDADQETEAPLVVEGNFTYSNCGTGCSVTEEGGPSVLEVLRESHETANVAYEFELHFNCFGINCYYNGEELLGTAKGPLLSTQANGEVSIQEQTVKKVKGTFCPSSGKLDLITTPLVQIRVTPPPIMACIKTEPKNAGLFKSPGSAGNCSNMTGFNTRDGEYELARVKYKFQVGEMACGRVNVGYLLTITVNQRECEDKDSPNREGTYELGEIKNLGP